MVYLYIQVSLFVLQPFAYQTVKLMVMQSAFHHHHRNCILEHILQHNETNIPGPNLSATSPVKQCDYAFVIEIGYRHSLKKTKQNIASYLHDCEISQKID